jgi:hypothetical protein
MKKLLFTMFALGLLNVLFLDRIHAQSCCVDKAACLKVTNQIEQTKCNPPSAATTQARPVQTATVASIAPAVVPAVLFSASFLANHLGSLVASIAKSKTSTDPCCIIPGCDPSDCDVSTCDPSKCSTAKN